MSLNTEAADDDFYCQFVFSPSVYLRPLFFHHINCDQLSVKVIRRSQQTHINLRGPTFRLQSTETLTDTQSERSTEAAIRGDLVQFLKRLWLTLPPRDDLQGPDEFPTSGTPTSETKAVCAARSDGGGWSWEREKPEVCSPSPHPGGLTIKLSINI